MQAQFPPPPLNLLDIYHLSSDADYYLQVWEQASRSIPPSPMCQTALETSPSALNSANYEQAFHSLLFERVRYLHCLDSKSNLAKTEV